MAICEKFLLLKIGVFQGDILLLVRFLVEYAFWGFIGLNGQGDGGFLECLVDGFRGSFDGLKQEPCA
tara:strand:+ start:364 stop:564 length:201 start_codon:yes stop_codon:yes gene_type:complete